MRLRQSAVLLLLLATCLTGHAQAPSGGGVHKLSAALGTKVGCFPAEGIETGDAAKGSSIIVERWSPGCVIPWHWHTPNEHVMMVSGALNFEIKGEKPTRVTAGDFVLISSHQISQAKCVSTQPCIDFLYTDAAFDVHFVDSGGKEISRDEAVKVAR